VTTNVAEFDHALRAAARAEGDAKCIRLLSEATDRYQGELLCGYYDCTDRAEG
jgi:hypothetical protein